MLRPYQQKCIDAILNSKSNQNLVSVPTGAGKTIIFSELAKKLDRRTLIIAHRDELILQAVDKMKWVWPDVDVGVVKAERNETNCQVTVASVQSMRAKRREQIDPNFGLVITDEAHHAFARTYKQVYDWAGCLPEQNNPDILHVGVTATPNRTDKKNLGDVFTHVAFEKDILDFIPEYLSDLQIIRRETGIVLDGISRSANDLNCHELSDALNTPQGNQMVVNAYKECAADRKYTIGFCADIAHVHGLTQAFLDEGIQACGIDSTMKIETRRKILKSFYDGKIKVLLNCGILTEGFDCPQIDCILLVRPTRSELLLRQMIGRGTRHHPGKDKCRVVDFVCVSDEWDLVSPAQLFDIETEEQEILSVAEMKEQKERHRKKYGNVDFSTRVAGIYDTRSPGSLYWQQIRWKGWILRCGEDGDIRILPSGTDLHSIDTYNVEHVQKIVNLGVDSGMKIISKVQENVSLDKAFAFAESYVRENQLDTSLAKPNRRWHSQPATENQIKYIRSLGAGEHIREGITKREASDLITFYKDKQEHERHQ